MTLESSEDIKRQVEALTTCYSSNVPIDEAVQNALPGGVKAVSAKGFGQSSWSFTAKVLAIDEYGQSIAYFLKYVPGGLGQQQLQGEFLGMSELNRLSPEFVPKAIGWGKLKDVAPASHFLLVEFKEFLSELPDPVKLGARVAQMHKRSASPNGMFGFQVQTFDGSRIQAIDWDPSWTSFFSKLLAEAYRQDVEANGTWPELDAVFKRVQSHLIPRLIGALESDGRKVRPTLIHGDMWDGNVATERSTGNPWIFDCAAYYGHNEMELGIWRAERHGLRAEVYRNEYLRHYPPSEPENEWDDRNRLYSAKTNLMHSACFAGSPARRLALNDFTYLMQRYVPAPNEANDVSEVPHP